MGSPRVFVSSTCYDLSEERDSLVDFCQNYGFDVALSERGDVFFHPDLHSHESCISEISNCHLFILIIGGRFGGRYVAEKNKSITNAEYSAAKEMNIPVFTFIKQDVLSDHNVWQTNKAKPFVKDIHYPSIDKQEHATEIFEFIDSVRLAKKGNSYFPFLFAKDIQAALRKQWAGMFLENLQKRTMEKQFSITNDSITKLTVASEKIEEIVKFIYKNVDNKDAEQNIQKIDLKAKASEFFLYVSWRIGDREFLDEFSKSDAENPPVTWWQFLSHVGFFQINEQETSPGKKSLFLSYVIGGATVAKISGDFSKAEEAEARMLAETYDAFLKIDKSARIEICKEYIFVDDEEPKQDAEK